MSNFSPFRWNECWPNFSPEVNHSLLTNFYHYQNINPPTHPLSFINPLHYFQNRPITYSEFIRPPRLHTSLSMISNVSGYTEPTRSENACQKYKSKSSSTIFQQSMLTSATTTVNSSKFLPTLDIKQNFSNSSLSTPTLYYHSHFKKGSLVIFNENTMRKVEDIQTSDFIEASEKTPEFSLDPLTIKAIATNMQNNVSTITILFPSKYKEMTIETLDDHPFFVFYKGWSSCNPMRTLLKYDLIVKKLMVGDWCISLQREYCDDMKRSSQCHSNNIQIFGEDDPLPSTAKNIPFSLSRNSCLDNDIFQQKESKSIPPSSNPSTHQTFDSFYTKRKSKSSRIWPLSRVCVDTKFYNNSFFKKKRRWSDPNH